MDASVTRIPLETFVGVKKLDEAYKHLKEGSLEVNRTVLAGLDPCSDDYFCQDISSLDIINQAKGGAPDAQVVQALWRVKEVVGEKVAGTMLSEVKAGLDKKRAGRIERAYQQGSQTPAAPAEETSGVPPDLGLEMDISFLDSGEAEAAAERIYKRVRGGEIVEGHKKLVADALVEKLHLLQRQGVAFPKILESARLLGVPLATLRPHLRWGAQHLDSGGRLSMAVIVSHYTVGEPRLREFADEFYRRESQREEGDKNEAILKLLDPVKKGKAMATLPPDIEANLTAFLGEHPNQKQIDVIDGAKLSPEEKDAFQKRLFEALESSLDGPRRGIILGWLGLSGIPFSSVKSYFEVESQKHCWRCRLSASDALKSFLKEQVLEFAQDFRKREEERVEDFSRLDAVKRVQAEVRASEVKHQIVRILDQIIEAS